MTYHSSIAANQRPNETGKGVLRVPVKRFIPNLRGPCSYDASERRRKCNIPAPGLACTSCSARDLACTRANPSVAKARSSISESTLVSRSDDLEGECTLPDQSLCIELVQLYFDYVHDKFHSLFHRPSLMEDLRRGQAPDHLIYGMLALSARYDPYSSARVETDLVDFQPIHPLWI